MCGVYGQIAKSAELNVDHQIQACRSISCRGPDSQGLVLGSSINQEINYIQSNNANFDNSKSSNNIFLKHFKVFVDIFKKHFEGFVSCFVILLIWALVIILLLAFVFAQMIF